MSFRARVIADSPNRCTLPRMGNMKCDVVAFLSDALFAQTDEALWRQAVESASYEGVKGVYLMPDTHLGYGIPVGGVVVTDDVIIQSGSGYDISCGVVYMSVPGLHASDIVPMTKRRQWVAEVEARVATGVGAAPTAMMRAPSAKLAEDVLRYGAKALGVPADVCERQYIPVGDDFDSNLIEKARGKVGAQLGSVGGGNHFIEMQVDAVTGDVWIMVHCGSRGYGWQTANHFFYAGAELRGLPKNRREASWLHAEEPLGRLYWQHHNAAANFAVANRHTIVRGVQDATERVFACMPEVYYEISHNLVQRETIVLPDGSTSTGFVHRKGATRAFPAGHPSLAGTRWQSTGHPCLVPGSMLDGAAILFPREGAYGSGCSVNHGSGRVLGRGEAKRQLGELQTEIDREMAEVSRTLGGVEVVGIAQNHAETPLDECGHVYKNLDAVLAVLEAENIASVAHRLYPVANIKGAD